MGGSGGSSSHGRASRGGGSGGGGAGGSRSRGESFNCSDFVATVELSSPRKSVIELLEVGDILWIQLTDGKAPIVALTEDDKVAGSVVLTKHQAQLINCMQNDTEYQATVKSIEDGSCVIEMYAVE